MGRKRMEGRHLKGGLGVVKRVPQSMEVASNLFLLGREGVCVGSKVEKDRVGSHPQFVQRHLVNEHAGRRSCFGDDVDDAGWSRALYAFVGEDQDRGGRLGHGGE